MSDNLIPIEVPPGIFTDDSDYGSGPVWVRSSLIRFLGKRLRKVGGWSSDPDINPLGVGRSILGWKNNAQTKDLVAVGTHIKLYVIENGTLTDITPVRATTNPLPGATPISATNGSPTVTITDTSHGAVDGDYVEISNMTASVGGLTLSGSYVVSGATTNTFDVTASSNATSTASGNGGGGVIIEYLLPTGTQSSVFSLGWGVGPWNEEREASGGYGDPAVAGQGIAIDPTRWSFSNWGELLIASYRNGGIYEWDPSTGGRATLVTNAPSTSKLALVANERHVVALGAHDGSNDDPLNVAWSDEEGRTVWTSTSTNKAGSRRLTHGNKIIGAVQSHGSILIHTDLSIHEMSWQGRPFTFSLKIVGLNCGLIGLNATIDVNGVAYWMGTESFFRYTGRAELIPCPVQRYVFDDMNADQKDKITVGLVSEFQEIWWFYPSSSSNEPDKYVTLNYVTGVWTVGELGRTAWTDKEGPLSNPTALDENGKYYSHESGVDADGMAMTSFAETGAFELGEAGDEQTHMSQIIPDIKDQSGSLKFYFYSRKYPNSTEKTKGPYSVTSSTKHKSVRVRGRQIRMKVLSDTTGSNWQLGKLRARVLPDGE